MKSFFIIFLALVLWNGVSLAQKPLNPVAKTGPQSIVEVLNADIHEGVNLKDMQTTTFTGNVVFRHEGVLMGCDKAIQNAQANTVDAFGNIKFNQGDTLTIVGDTLFYNGFTRIATIWGRQVTLRDKKVTLKTKRVIYNLADGMAYYPVAGEIMQDSSKLTSNTGYYNTRTKFFNYIGDVKITHPKFELNTDSLDYNAITKLAIFKTFTTIDSENGKLSSSKGTYNIKTKESYFSERSRVENDEFSLEGDTLSFDDQNDFGRANGNVVFVSKKDSIISVGNEGIRIGKIGITKMNGETISKLISQGDTAYLAADTLRIIEKKNEQIAQKLFKTDSLSLKDSTAADSALTPPKNLMIFDLPKDSPLDSNQKRTKTSKENVHYIMATGNVRTFRKDVQSISDSLIYNAVDSTVGYYKNPFLWHKNNQLKADSIDAHFKNNQISKMDMVQNCFIIEEDTLKNLNQIKGRYISTFFNDSTQIELIDIYGNAEYKYFILTDEQKIVGLDMVQCSSIKFLFSNEQLDLIKYYTDCEGELVPPQELKLSEAKFEDFDYKISEKPSKESILALKNGDLLKNSKF